MSNLLMLPLVLTLSLPLGFSDFFPVSPNSYFYASKTVVINYRLAVSVGHDSHICNICSFGFHMSSNWLLKPILLIAHPDRFQILCTYGSTALRIFICGSVQYFHRCYGSCCYFPDRCIRNDWSSAKSKREELQSWTRASLPRISWYLVLLTACYSIN